MKIAANNRKGWIDGVERCLRMYDLRTDDHHDAVTALTFEHIRHKVMKTDRPFNLTFGSKTYYEFIADI